MLRINVVIRMWVIHATLPDCKNVRMHQARKMEMSSLANCKLITKLVQKYIKHGTYVSVITKRCAKVKKSVHCTVYSITLNSVHKA